MMKNSTRLQRSPFLFVCLALLVTGTLLTAGEEAGPKKKLKIVFLMGQSNMVGYSHPLTAWYLTQPMYVPPPETATAKGRTYEQGGFYWSGVSFAQGDSEEYNARGEALMAERSASRRLWRSRIYGNFGRSVKENNWNYKEWGEPPTGGRAGNVAFLEKKAEEEGIYKRMAEYIESPENKRPPKVAIELIAKRDEPIADDIKRVRELFLKGTKPEDFDRLDEALKAKGKDLGDRSAFAELVKEYVHLPIAERTWITALGEVNGEPIGPKGGNVTQGRLSVGFAKFATNFGPEYPFGITFEQLVDGPVLLVKCAWGGTSLKENWRPASLMNSETPTEKAAREAAVKPEADETGDESAPAKPEPDEGPSNGCWVRSMDHIRKVLADPGKYCPDYDPEAGYECVGLVWFQGWNDAGNKAYGEQLVTFINDFRKEVKTPDMPVVCGLLGHAAWKKNTFGNDVNRGMLYAASDAGLKGTVDIVNTVKYFPIELGMLGSVKMAYGEDSDEYKKAEQIIKRSSSKDGTHYFGSAKFLCLTGNAMARSLANLVAGGEPTIFKEAEEILGEK